LRVASGKLSSATCNSQPTTRNLQLATCNSQPATRNLQLATCNSQLAMPTSYIVATVDEIPPGGRKIFEISGRSIGVFNIGGEFFAIRNQCPHQGGPLCAGRLSGFLIADQPGQYHYSRRGEILRCPWHGWEFEVKTGQSWFDPQRTRVRSYQVSVTANPPPGSEPVAPGLEPGPYVAETYPVTVERPYVLVDI
jgi:nitrite reductase/ring-hydroxylating ferredoxin subunit